MTLLTDRRGVQLVSFALVFPFLLAILLAIWDLARLVSARSALQVGLESAVLQVRYHDQARNGGIETPELITYTHQIIYEHLMNNLWTREALSPGPGGNPPAITFTRGDVTLIHLGGPANCAEFPGRNRRLPLFQVEARLRWPLLPWRVWPGQAGRGETVITVRRTSTVECLPGNWDFPKTTEDRFPY